MSWGVEVRDGSGNVLVGGSTHTGFILGAVTLTSGNQSGSLTNAGFAKGAPFFFAAVPDASPQPIPTVSFAGTTMTWTSIGQGNYLGNIFYGIR